MRSSRMTSLRGPPLDACCPSELRVTRRGSAAQAGRPVIVTGTAVAVASGLAVAGALIAGDLTTGELAGKDDG